MALPRFQKLPAERRHRLIAAAAVEFAAKGYQGAALTAIAEKSGMGKASFYYYFADKADLCATVLDEAWRRFRLDGRLDLEALTRETFWPSFAAMTRENLAKCGKEPWLLAAAKLFNRSTPHPSGEAVLDAFREKRRAWEEAFIRRGQEVGAVRSDVPADLLVAIALSVRQSSNLWLLERVEDMSLERSNDLALHVFEIYRALLSPPAVAGDKSVPAPRRSRGTLSR